MGVMWREWGINPSVIIGHSLGEYAAFVLAGCLSVEDAIQLIIWRTQALYASNVVSSDGGMMAIGVGGSIAQGILKDSGCSGLSISCYNSPTQTCVSGPRTELLKLQAFAHALPHAPLVKMLQSQLPWHCSMLEDAAERFRSLAESVIFHPAKVPMILNIDGSVLQPGDIPPPSYLVEQMVKPVRFDLCADNTLAKDANIWIELSARTVILPLLRPLLPSGVTLLPTIGRAETECWSPITKALARLYEAQIPIKWAAYHNPYQHKLIPLPSYPFTRTRHWIEYRDRLHLSQCSPPKESSHDIISTPIGPLEVVEPWRRYILHTNGQHLHPGAYIWLALSCTKGTNTIVDLQVTNPAAQGSYLTILVAIPSPTYHAVSFIRHHDERTVEDGMIIANCKVKVGSFTVIPGTEKVFQRSRTKLLKNPASWFFSKAMVAKMASMDIVNSDQALASLAMSDDGVEAVGQIRWNNKDVVGDWYDEQSSLSHVALNPSQLRSLLQLACLAMSLNSGAISPNIAYAMDQLDLVKDFDKEPAVSDAEDLYAHVFINISSESSELQDVISQSYIYSKNGLGLGCVMGFRKSRIEDLINTLDFHLPNHRPENSIPATIAPLISSPGSRTDIEDKDIQSPFKEENSYQKTLTESMITDVLSGELGIPAHSILAKDKLEDLGVDSIMSLLLRDKFRQLSGRPVEWFQWKRGLSVLDLWSHVLNHV